MSECHFSITTLRLTSLDIFSNNTVRDTETKNVQVIALSVKSL